MTPDDPRHGTTAGYSAHGTEIPCRACKDAKNIYEQARERQKAYGRWEPWVDAEPVREHIRSLMAEGTSIRQIAKSAGVSLSRVGFVIYGRGEKAAPKKLRPQFAATILAIQGNPAIYPIIGTQRRIGALIAIGYDQVWIGRMLGVSQGRVWRYATGRHQTISAQRFVAVSALYESYAMKPPTPTTKAEKYAAARARDTAKRNGYLPPLAWNNIDDPDERPVTRGPRKRSHTDVDPVVILRVMAGDRLPMTRAERVAVVTQMSAAGWSQDRIEQHTGITRVDRLIERDAS